VDNKDFFLKTAKDAGITISHPSSMVSQFLAYKELLVHHNKFINLTAITEDKEIIKRHFVDSLTPMAYINIQGQAIDVGTGAGLPGLPLSIALPDTSFTLLDALKKRVAFLETVKGALQLDNVTIIQGRAEEIAYTHHREAYDFVMSRGVAPLISLAEYCLPFAKIGGRFVAYKGRSYKEEVEIAAPAIGQLGGEITNIINYDNTTGYTLIIISKLRQTPPNFPRKQNKIKNSPILR